MLMPEQRFYPAEGQDMTDTAIRTTGFRDLYLALGDDRGGGRWTLRAYVTPLAPFIWLGGLVMALGGMLSLWGRLRVQAPSAARRAGAAWPRNEDALVRLLLLLALVWPRRCAAAPVAAMTLSPIRRWKRAPAICSGNCAAWSARARASTNPARPLPPICAIWCASRSPTAKATSRSRISGGPLWRLHPDEAAAAGRHLFLVAGAVSGLDWAAGGRGLGQQVSKGCAAEAA